jgi:hypothetical protein
LNTGGKSCYESLDIRLHPLPSKQLLDATESYWKTGMPSDGATVHGYNNAGVKHLVVSNPDLVPVANQAAM